MEKNCHIIIEQFTRKLKCFDDSIDKKNTEKMSVLNLFDMTCKQLISLTCKLKINSLFCERA